MFSMGAFSSNALNFRHLLHCLICLINHISEHSGPIEIVPQEICHLFYSEMSQTIMTTLQCLLSKCSQGVPIA